MIELGSLIVIDMDQDEDENGKNIRLLGVGKRDRCSRCFKPEILVTYKIKLRKGERLIGDEAKKQLISNPEKFHDQAVQRDINSFPFKVFEKNAKPIIQVNVGNEQKLFTPEEISTTVLRKMRDIVEASLGEKVTHAIITLSTYSNDAQRQGKKYGATICGLNVVHLINEAMAVAIFIILNLGGGTVDAAFIQYDNDHIIDVVATSGCTNLGDKYFDQCAMEYFIELFENKTDKDLRKDTQAVQKLQHEVEKMKQILSKQDEDEAEIEIKLLFDNENFSEKSI